MITPINFRPDKIVFELPKHHEKKFLHLFLGMVENSNFRVARFIDRDFNVIYNQGQNCVYLQLLSVPIICIQDLDRDNISNRSYRITIYGSAFPFGLARKYFYKFLKEFPDLRVTALDVCFDLPIDYKKTVRGLICKKKDVMTKTDSNYPVWSRFGSKSGNYGYLRVYNKLLDISAKKKTFMHPELDDHPVVTRVEYAFLSDALVGLNLTNYQSLFDSGFLYKMLKKVLLNRRSIYLPIFNKVDFFEAEFNSDFYELGRKIVPTKKNQELVHVKYFCAYYRACMGHQFNMPVLVAYAHTKACLYDFIKKS